MTNQTQTPPPYLIQSTGLLTARGLLYILFGLVLLLIAPPDRPDFYWLFALLPALSGACSIGFGLAKGRTDRNSRWFVVGGVIDLIFSAVMFFYVGRSGMADRFWTVMVLWSIQYGIVQAVQAMYPFGSTPSVPALRGPVARLHLLSALIAIGLFATLQVQPAESSSALGVSAVLFMVLGGLVLLIAPRLRAARSR